MTPILQTGAWIEFESIESTQDFAIQKLSQNIAEAPSVIFAYHQTKARGRFQRPWESANYESLSMTIILKEYKNHPAPWLLGMKMAIAAATALDLQVQWPNDLTLNQKKLGGILTEIIHDIPVLGIGINLNQTEFPNEYRRTPTSYFLERNQNLNPKETALKILQLFQELPYPNTWADLSETWHKKDDSCNKTYYTPQGETYQATGIGNQGELIVNTPEGTKSLWAAEYLYNAPV